MKLTDWCILFAALFFCMLLPLDLKTAYLAQSFCQQKKYDRMLDRACEDSLMDSVRMEREDGSVVVDEQQVYARFGELLQMDFDSVSEEEREYLLQCVRMKQFHDLGQLLEPAQADAVRSQMEQALADSREKRLKLFFPYIEGEDWYQNLAGPSFYAFFEADSTKDPLEKYRRYVFSGGRIVKQQPEAGPSAD